MAVVLGCDVGGTNTDCAVLSVPDGKVVGKYKAATTPDVTAGIVRGVQEALKSAGAAAASVQYLSIGTTHFVNAVVQRSPELSRVVVLRCCGPATRSIRPCQSFPPDLAARVHHSHAYIDGGFEFDGSLLSPFDEDTVRKQVMECLKAAAADGVSQVVVSGVFSSVKPEQERKVAEIVREEFPAMSVTLSGELATLGLIERESSAVLNAAIRPLAERTIEGFKEAIAGAELRCPLYLTKNDGTIMPADKAKEFPVLTFTSGPTNSMRGAAFLAGIADAVVVDIGGTTADAGVLVRGFPRPCPAETFIGGVKTNFRIPDVRSIGLGGGSRVDASSPKLTIGPLSVGYKLTSEALCFGGSTVTATDLAVASRGVGILGPDSGARAVDPAAVGGEDVVKRGEETILRMVEECVDEMKSSAVSVPVLLVGGGSVIVPPDTKIQGCSEIAFPEHFEVANAVGAAIAQVSGTVDVMRRLEGEDRAAVEAELRALATKRAVEAGATAESVKIREFDQLAVPYLPGDVHRYVVMAVGDMSTFSAAVSSAREKEAEAPAAEFSEPKGRVQGMGSPPDPTTTLNAGSDGVWELTEADVGRIAVGAGILGTGGGGNPYHSTLRAKECIRQGKKMRVLSFDALKDADFILPVGFMGTPTVLVEKQSNGRELGGAVDAVCALQKPTEGGRELIISCEIGGLNAIEPLIAGASSDRMVLDADLMGRAFPKLDMVLPFINQVHMPVPAALADDKDNAVIMYKASPQSLEKILRAVTTSVGGTAGLSLPPMKGSVGPGNVVPFSMTKAWKLGKVIEEALAAKQDPVAALIAATRGRLLIRGKVADVARRTVGGFARGVVTVAGLKHDELFSGKEIKLDIQNECLLARSPSGEVLASTPDLISMIDTLTGTAVFTEDVRYGMRVSVAVMPITKLMRTEAAIKVCGPAAFGYDVEYKSAED
eukprot:TRINITY_DN19240_c0_g1_i1.p1 TRINITY_DN19240_c0_g1~~TRINITY_DN19240_c0_g1_i1.p1  ORF type:complete len:963 (+),score=213.09 TRINITY_DN19240_c0_g1_i1:63-2891(+)